MEEFIDITEYDYPLPDNCIAVYPLAERDCSRLLFYNKGHISHHNFSDLPQLLPADTLLIRNVTKVVQARLIFTRKTGGIVEVFCLEPLLPHKEMSLAMQQKAWTTWKCMAKKLKKWKAGEKLYLALYPYGKLEAELITRDGKFCEVRFTWDPEEQTWAQVLELAGKVPLPPYIHREAGESDKAAYQTIYASSEGAVAAPTAGLHFTPAIIQKLEQAGIFMLSLTLHVSAGTFQPVEEGNALEHPMHREQIIFEKSFIEELACTPKKIISVGTTSLRAVESLYWFGEALTQDEGLKEFFVSKMQPYILTTSSRILSDSKSVMRAILKWMEDRNLQVLTGYTEIFIFPGYEFKMIKGLITNFHQPQSTLLLLVSALIGESWKDIYAEALEKEYRFLSYGDSSLLLP